MLELMKEWDGLAVAATDADFQFQLKPGEWQTAQAEFEARLNKRLTKFRK
jgi:hypothetical protein